MRKYVFLGLSGGAGSRTFRVLTLFVLLGSAPALSQTPSAGNYVIGPQDVLAVNVFDQASLTGKFTVEADGTFSFPLVGRIKAAGLTLREFEQELKKQLADGFFKNPQVSVAVEQYRSQRVFVVGEVRQPGPVPLTGGMTLIEALSRAGSTLPSSSGEVVVVRQKDKKPIAGPTLPGEKEASEVIRVSIRTLESGELSRNVELQDGDTIFVPRAESIYVFGQVKNPGSYLIQKDTTVLQALSLAGGVTENGAMNRIRIVRLVDDKRTEMRVNERDIVKPGDTVVVPERFF
jgi:polysaccharide export outer membrane protein